MKPFLYCFIFLISVLSSINVKGQATCTGSFGDPVIEQNFGSGGNQGPALSAAITNYPYVNKACPDDGFYTLANSTSNCFNTWNTVTHDHTGNANGYFMLVNAANAKGLFFTQEADNLCPNTTYEFAAYIMNMINPNAPSTCGTNIMPNITFRIEDASGNLLAPEYNTGDIPAEAAIGGAGPWHKYATTFTTTTATSVVVKLINNAPGGCGNDLALDDITFRACGPQILAGFGTTIQSADQQLCFGHAGSYPLTASISSGYVNPQLQWQSNTNNAGWIDIPGKTTNSYTANIPANAAVGTYQYRLAVSEATNAGSANCRTFSNTLTVQVNPIPVAVVGPAQAVCEGQPINLAASGGATYAWTGPNGYTSAQQNPVISNSVPGMSGTYTVAVTSAAGCTSPGTNVSVTVAPKINATATANEATICAGQSTTLKATGGTSYAWSPAAGLSATDVANPIAKPAVTTTYTVIVSNGACSDTKTVTVTVLEAPVADAGENKIILEGQSVKLDGKASPNTDYRWEPIDNLDNPFSLTPVATPTDDITYTLHVISKIGCGETTDNVFVRVYKKITVHNTFSPNSDGINDTWNVEALVTYPNCSVNVYDRYGQEVYKSTGYPKEWNGTYNGKVLPTASYYYVIDLKNGTTPLSGWVMIVR